MSTRSLGGIRLFQFRGITVYLHWTWFIVAVLGVRWGIPIYHTVAYATAAYLSLFAIVLLHEFGHSFACRSVGGEANRIILWPLGGAAFVKPPARPGALLWSIAAGPLVNVVLLLVSIPLFVFFWNDNSNLGRFIISGFCLTNLLLLVFNMLPIYPLDGGQIVRALLWYVIGRTNSLAVSGVVGLLAGGAGGLVALYYSQWWLALVAAFAAFQSWTAVVRSSLLRRRQNAPRWAGFNCPACGMAPPVGAFWLCKCGKTFDTFAHSAQCPYCAAQYQLTQCLDCGSQSPMIAWHAPLPLPPVGSEPAPML